VLDETGARLQLAKTGKGKNRSVVTVRDIERTIAFIARIPEKTVSSSEKEKLKNLERDLKMLIFGQDEAIDKVTSSILLTRSGLGHETRPVANFLFVGATGVGKTELAKQLAKLMGIHFERVDMSEYMEKHSVSKLIGAPPGYVGHDQGGILTESINKNPHAVLLLDEIEKAHEDVFNILLQVMDHGKLTDSNGRTTDFRNVVLIMTSNAGARERESGSIGLGAKLEDLGKSKGDKVIKQLFSPEFRNRLDAIVQFNPLSNREILLIVDKFLIQLEDQLTKKGVVLNISQDVRNWLAEKAYDPKLGARPIARFIDEKIRRYLAKEILFGGLEKGGVVEIALLDDNLSFSFKKQKVKKQKEKQAQES